VALGKGQEGLVYESWSIVKL